MKVKELKALLNKCNDESEIGVADLGGVYEIDGINMVLCGMNAIDTMMYAIRATEEMDEVDEVSSSLVEDIENNSFTKLQALNRDLVKCIERNQIAWEHSRDKHVGLLPEVYLENRMILEKLKGEK